MVYFIVMIKGHALKVSFQKLQFSTNLLFQYFFDITSLKPAN